MVVIYRTALYNFALAGWLHESQKPLKKRHVFVLFNCSDFECQSHVNWTSMSITLEANVIDIVFQGGCARASAVFFTQTTCQQTWQDVLHLQGRFYKGRFYKLALAACETIFFRSICL